MEGSVLRLRIYIAKHAFRFRHHRDGEKKEAGGLNGDGVELDVELLPISLVLISGGGLSPMLSMHCHGLQMRLSEPYTVQGTRTAAPHGVVCLSVHLVCLHVLCVAGGKGERERELRPRRGSHGAHPPMP